MVKVHASTGTHCIRIAFQKAKLCLLHVSIKVARLRKTKINPIRDVHYLVDGHSIDIYLQSIVDKEEPCGIPIVCL